MAVTKGRQLSPNPADDYFAVTPSDATDLAVSTRGLFVGGAGNLVAVKEDNTTVTFTGVIAGQILPIRVRRVNATNTTATNIVALV